MRKLKTRLTVVLLGVLALPPASALADNPFNPGLSVSSTTMVAGEQAQIELEMTNPAAGEPSFDDPDLKDVSIKLPAGLFPSAGSGKYCELQNLGSEADPHYSCKNPEAKTGSSLLWLKARSLDTGDELDLGPLLPLQANTYIDKAKDAGEVARLVSILEFDNSSVVESPIKVAQDGGGVRIALGMEDLPQTVEILGSGYEAQIYKIKMTLGSEPTSPLTNPAYCDAPNGFDAVFTSYGGETVAKSEGHVFTDCQFVPYRPDLQMTLTDTSAGKPAALGSKMAMPLGDAPTKSLKVSIPAEFLFNPDNPVKSCPQDLFLLAQCPQDAKMATTKTATPLLPEPVTGSSYLGPPSGNDLKTLLVYDKLSGARFEGLMKERPDHGIDLVFENMPPLPTTAMEMSFNKGEAGVFLNPFKCGTYTATSSFTSYNGKSVMFTHPLTITGCSQALSNPGIKLDASLSKVRAGRYTDFSARIDQDSPAAIASAQIELPKGMARIPKKLKGKNIATIQLWDRAALRGDSELKLKRVVAGKKLVFKAKKKALAGLTVEVRRFKQRGLVTVSGLPEGNLTDFTFRTFSRQFKLLKTPSSCTKPLTFKARVTRPKVAGQSFEPREATDSVKLKCKAKATS